MSNIVSVNDLLLACRAAERFRDCIDRTWVERGYRIATDGRVCMQVACTDAPTDPSEGPFPPTFDLPWDRAGKKVESPKFIAPPEGKSCTECAGTGKTDLVDCEECDGTGSGKCPHCGQEAECDECKGSGLRRVTGRVPCPTCEATGLVSTGRASIKVGSAWYNPDYIEAFVAAGGQFFDVDPEKKESTRPPLLVVGDGWRACIMPMLRAVEADDVTPVMKFRKLVHPPSPHALKECDK